MVFSSHLFIFYFLPAALLLYYIAPRRGRHLALTLLSYAFYGWANPYFMPLMFLSTVVDYICGRVIAQGGDGLLLPRERSPRSRRQKVALLVSILTNLSLLGFFKYFNFGIDSWNGLVAGLGLEHWAMDTFLWVTLPLGISFYTFQSMSYTIDVYRGHAAVLRNFIDFACYVSMFPQLVAGPIIRFSEVADQLRSRTHTMEKFARGVAMFSLGSAKKILLANPCGRIADATFDAGSVETFDAWYGTVAYAFQIYFDFSAYSDMAIGLGLMLGFVFPKNFDSPYIAKSITEFWRRWHISLSSWLRDYLYIPLGGNRHGEVRTYINLALVMLLGGLWHGSDWTFVIWGAIHGGWLALERASGKKSFYRSLPGPFKMLLTFLIVNIAWVFFRTESLDHAWRYLGNMFGGGSVQEGAELIQGVIYAPYYAGSFVLAAIVTWTMPQTWDWTRKLTPTRGIIAIALFLLSILILETQSYNPFIYFIF